MEYVEVGLLSSGLSGQWMDCKLFFAYTDQARHRSYLSLSTNYYRHTTSPLGNLKKTARLEKEKKHKTHFSSEQSFLSSFITKSQIHLLKLEKLWVVELSGSRNTERKQEHTIQYYNIVMSFCGVELRIIKTQKNNTSSLLPSPFLEYLLMAAQHNF